MKNIEVVIDKISELIKTFAFEGEVLMLNKQGLIADISNLANKTLPVYKYVDSFVAIMIVQLMETKGHSFSDKIDIYFPDLKHADKISFEDLLRDRTGLVDIHGYLAKFHADDAYYQSLTDEQKMEYDANASVLRLPDEQVIKIYNQFDLEHKPGATMDYNSVTENLGTILLERAYQRPYNDILADFLASIDITPKYYHKPVNRFVNRYRNRKVTMKLDQNSFIGLTSFDAYKLYMALKNGKLVSKASLKKMQKLIEFQGIGFSDYYPFVRYFDLGRFGIYDFKEIDLIIIEAIQFEGYEQVIDGDNFFFANNFMRAILPYVIDFKAPKLVKLSKHNVYDLLHIENDEKQMWFMGPTKYSLAYQYVEKNVYCYLLLDHGIAVGTVCLHIDKEGDFYDIANVLIDKKYQGRGYGKAIINESLKIFAKHDVKSLTLYVNKDNPIAYRTYLSCGFKVKAAFPTSYEMIYHFEK